MAGAGTASRRRRSDNESADEGGLADSPLPIIIYYSYRCEQNTHKSYTGLPDYPNNNWYMLRRAETGCGPLYGHISKTCRAPERNDRTRPVRLRRECVPPPLSIEKRSNDRHQLVEVMYPALQCSCTFGRVRGPSV